MARKTTSGPSAYILNLCREELLNQTAHDVGLMVETVCQYPYTEEIADLLFSCLPLYSDSGIRERILNYLLSQNIYLPRLSEAALTCLAETRNTQADMSLIKSCTAILLLEDPRIVLARIEGMIAEADKPARRIALRRLYVTLIQSSEDLLLERLSTLDDDLLSLLFETSSALLTGRFAPDSEALRALLARGLQSSMAITRSKALRLTLETGNLSSLSLPSG